MIGGNAASKAANQQRASNINAANQVDLTSQNVNNQINKEITGAQTGDQAAVAAANTGIGGAVQQANAGIQTNTNQIQQNYSPYTSAGSTAVNNLQTIGTGGSPLGSTFSAPSVADVSAGGGNAGYQFTLQQGQQAIQRAAAAQGGLFSTGTMKSLANYTTGTANQYYNTAYNQALQTFQANQQSALNQASVLQNLSGQGLAATQGGANALQTSGLAQGQNLTQGANAQGTNLTQGAQYQGTAGLTGAIQGGGLIQQAALEAGNFGTGAGNAAAQGTLAQGQAGQSIVNSVANGLSTYLNGRSLGGTGLEAPTVPGTLSIPGAANVPINTQDF